VDGIDDDKQLANGRHGFRAHEAAVDPMDQAVMDYHVVGTQLARRRRRPPIAVILAGRVPRSRIDHFAAAFDAADIQLEAIDVEAFALLRGRRARVPRRADDERTAVRCTGLRTRSHHTGDSPTERVCDFTRVLEWGGGRLDAANRRASSESPPRRPKRSSSASR